MQVVIAGASGFLGSHLSDELVRRGHAVTALVRRPTSSTAESSWDPYAGTYDRSVVEAADVVVNLAGAPTVGNPHSQKWARELRESRIATTRVLARAVADSDSTPAFLAGNAIAYYGDRGDEVLTEASDSRGDAMLTALTRDWQAAAEPAAEAGARLCVLRTAPVMDRSSAPLKQLRLLFKAGLGARLGDGRQYMAMISLRDWLGGVVHLVEHETVSGPVNLSCPKPPTNREFTEALAAILHRRALVAVPRFAIQVGAGKAAPDLLGSLNVRPAALEAAGYEFQDPDVTAILRTGLATD